MRVRAGLAYHGAAFHGFAKQSREVTVQSILETALWRYSGQQIVIQGASRTDAGVHAVGQIVAFHWEPLLPIVRLPLALRAYLPASLVLFAAEEVADSFDPTRQAVRKTYRYSIWNHSLVQPLLADRMWHVPGSLDIAAMLAAAQYLIGEHDFTSFAASGGSHKQAVRNLERLDLQMVSDHGLEIEFTANGFLYHMVRNLVGTLIEIGLGQRRADSMAHIFAGKDRRLAGKTAPAHGLTLLSVEYPKPLDIWRLG